MSNTSAKNRVQTLLEQLCDPARSSEAILALLSQGKASVPALVEFLRTLKPSTVAEPRLLAVEGLSILKGHQALEVLIEVATERLEAISDPVVRLAEEAVASRAALALADFTNASARETLLGLLHRKPLAGVAEAFEKLSDCRAIPHLIEWLEEDFVSEPASRAIFAYGRAAISHLLASLAERHLRRDTETGMSQRRRARILEILTGLARAEDVTPIEGLLQDPIELVRFHAVQLFLQCGALPQKLAAFGAALRLLESRDNGIRNGSQELLTSHVYPGFRLLEEEIGRRRARGESEEPCYPRETTLAILVRIARSSSSGCRKERPS